MHIPRVWIGLTGIVLCLGHLSLGMGWRPFKSSDQDAGREARAFMRSVMGRDVDVAGVVVDKDGVPLDSVKFFVSISDARGYRWERHSFDGTFALTYPNAIECIIKVPNP